MSVLIYGMDMPGEKEFSHVRIYGDGDVTVEVGGEEHVIAKAINVPTPHGRLIDADEIGSTLALYKFKQNSSTIHYDEFGNWFIYPEELDQVIEKVPTIIEAEEGLKC